MTSKRDTHYTYRLDRTDAASGDAWILRCLQDGIEIDRRVFLVESYADKTDGYDAKLGRAHRAAVSAATVWLARKEIARLLHSHRRLYAETSLLFFVMTAITLLLLKPAPDFAGLELLVGTLAIAVSASLAAFSYLTPNAYVDFITWIARRTPRD